MSVAPALDLAEVSQVHQGALEARPASLDVVAHLVARLASLPVPLLHLVELPASAHRLASRVVAAPLVLVADKTGPRASHTRFGASPIDS